MSCVSPGSQLHHTHLTMRIHKHITEAAHIQPQTWPWRSAYLSHCHILLVFSLEQVVGSGVASTNSVGLPTTIVTGWITLVQLEAEVLIPATVNKAAEQDRDGIRTRGKLCMCSR